MVIGGTASVAAGGKFANGAITGAFQAAAQMGAAGNDGDVTGGGGRPDGHFLKKDGQLVYSDEIKGGACQAAVQCNIEVDGGKYHGPRGEDFHTGSDFVPRDPTTKARLSNANALSMVSGKVVDVGARKGLGANVVEIQTDNGDFLVFGHMSSSTVTKGQSVTPSTVVGVIGSEGATNIHLHVQMIRAASSSFIWGKSNFPGNALFIGIQ